MNNRGFSLVQIIISLGILSGLFVAALKIIQNQTELGKSSSYRFESLLIMDEVKSVLSDPVSCLETLKGRSAIYDEIKTINSYDPRAKSSEVIYSTYAQDKKPLGQNNIYLRDIFLNGEVKGFTDENGYTSMVMIFSEKEAGGEEFKVMFPIRVTLNELGRITACQARPGIHQEKSSRTVNDPWGKVKNENGDVTGVSFTQGPVTIGQIPGLAALNSQGGVLLYGDKEPGECGPNQEGTLYFSAARQVLSLCRKDGTWHALHGVYSLGQYSKDYNLETSKNEPMVITTPENFHVCRLLRIDSPSGQCSTTPVNRVASKPQWELLGQNYRDGKTKCTFRCFR